MKVFPDSPYGCEECGKHGPCVLIEGTDENVHVCAECLQKALDLVRADPTAGGDEHA